VYYRILKDDLQLLLPSLCYDLPHISTAKEGNCYKLEILCSANNKENKGFGDRKRPSWCPPGYVFAIVWSCLALTRCTAAVLAWEASGQRMLSFPLLAAALAIVCSLKRPGGSIDSSFLPKSCWNIDKLLCYIQSRHVRIRRLSYCLIEMASCCAHTTLHYVRWHIIVLNPECS
jgi:hypothetical protein